jgi:hypothetical protein
MNIYSQAQDVGFRVRRLDRGYAMNKSNVRQFYAASCIRTSENSSSTQFVNKGKKKGRGPEGRRPAKADKASGHTSEEPPVALAL